MKIAGSPGMIFSFNSRAPRGARLFAILFFEPLYGVSIHVPLAEHDLCAAPLLFFFARFNSRAPRGARRHILTFRDHLTRFNSRAPRGARLQGHAAMRPRQSFNSRAPRGARQPLQLRRSEQ